MSLSAAIAGDIDWLRAHQPPFDRVPNPDGRPGFAMRDPGFGTLIWLILGQQVSIRAAAAMWAKLVDRLGAVTPAGMRSLDEATLRACGFSRQKVRYAGALADAVDSGAIDLEGLGTLSDEAVIETLCVLPGIGRWTAENYLLWALGRRDVIPAGDLALLIGWQWLSDGAARPTPDDLRQVAEAWRPRRTAATFLIWAHYLDTQEARRGAGRRGVR